MKRLPRLIGPRNAEADKRLVQAVECDRYDDVVRALNEGADPNQCVEILIEPRPQEIETHKIPLVQWAAGSIRMLHALLRHGADPNCGCGGGSPALGSALWHSSAFAVYLLLEAGASPEGLLSHCRCPAAVSLLLSYGADPNAEDGGLRSMVQAERGWDELPQPMTSQQRDEMFGLMIRNGANPGRRDKRGRTVVHTAVLSNRIQPLRCLLTLWGGVGCRDRAGRTALHLAVRSRQPELVCLLIAHQALLDAGDCDGNTPLHVAARLENAEIAQILIRSGADLEAINVRGRTPLDLSVGLRSGKGCQAAMQLINAGAAIPPDRLSRLLRYTLRRAAVLREAPEFTEFLLERGADVSHLSPFDFAMMLRINAGVNRARGTQGLCATVRQVVRLVRHHRARIPASVTVELL